jgi:hypothetical protein
MKLNIRKIVRILITILTLFFPESDKKADKSGGEPDAQN